MKERKPDWLKIKWGTNENIKELKRMMRGGSLHTVCQEAKCPNIFECWSQRTATFMINGSICTRGCRFFAVTTGLPTELDLTEPEKVAKAAEQMGLKHDVVTAVARDDLKDGGASAFALTIQAIRRRLPLCNIEVLISDFQGKWDSLRIVLDSNPNI